MFNTYVYHTGCSADCVLGFHVAEMYVSTGEYLTLVDVSALERISIIAAISTSATLAVKIYHV